MEEAAFNPADDLGCSPPPVACAPPPARGNWVPEDVPEEGSGEEEGEESADDADDADDDDDLGAGAGAGSREGSIAANQGGPAHSFDNTSSRAAKTEKSWFLPPSKRPRHQYNHYPYYHGCCHHRNFHHHRCFGIANLPPTCLPGTGRS